MVLPSGKQFVLIIIASILLGHFFVSIGRPETIIDLFSQSWYYTDLFFVSVISFSVVSYVAVVHHSLDARIPLRDNFKRRVLLQSASGIVAPSLLAFALTFIYMEFVLVQDIWSTTFLLYEFPISIVVIVAINLVFIVASLLEHKTPAARSSILVTQAGKTVPVSVNHIGAVTKEGDHTLVCTFDQQQFVTGETLEEIFGSLPPSEFFRANRQWIVHRSACGAYDTERSGKINLTLKEPFVKEISVSQKRAQDFKRWLAS